MPRPRTTRRSRHHYLAHAAGLLVLIGGTSDLLAQTQSTWQFASSGQFTDAGRWSSYPYAPNNGSPAGATYDAFVLVPWPGHPYDVAFSSPVALDSLTLGGDANLLQTNTTLQLDTLHIRDYYARYTAAGSSTLTANQILIDNNSSLTVPSGATLTLAGSPTFSGSGRFDFHVVDPGDGSDPGPKPTVVIPGTFTIAAGSTLEVGSDDPYSGQFTGPGTIVNYGTLAGNGVVSINTASVHNFGLIRTGHLFVSNLINEPGAVFQADGGSHSVNLASNAGTLRVLGRSSMAILNNVTPSQLGTLDNQGGVFSLSGGLNLAGASYSLPASAGTVRIGNTLGNGRLSGAGATLAGTVTLDNLTLASALTVPAGVSANVPSTLTFDGGTLTLEGALRLSANPVAGTGQIAFSGYSTGADSMVITPSDGIAVATLGPGIAVTTAARGGTLGSATQSVHALGPISCPANTLYVNGPDWSLADLTISGTGTVHLQGTFPTSRLTGIHRPDAGGALIIDDTLDNTGATLDLANTGNLTLAGTIQGGTIASSNGANLTTLPSSKLNAVTVDCDLNLPSYLSFSNSLTLADNHTISFSYFPQVSGTGSITGSGTIFLTGPSSSNGGITADAIGPGITLRTAPNTSGVNVNANINVPSLQGTVSAETPRVTVSLVAGNWVNTGTLSVSGGTLSLGNSFSPSSVGTLVRSGNGTVQVVGTLNMPPGDDTLLLNASTGTWNFAGATVNGGTIRTADGAVAQFSAGTTTFQGVTLDGNARISSGATLNTGATGLTLANATVTLGGGSATLRGPLLGTGQIFFNGGLVAPTSSAYTYAPTISFSSTGASSGIIGAPGQSITTQGNILAQNGATILLAASNFTNAGLITAGASSTVKITGAFTNTGRVDFAGGNVILDYTGTSPIDAARAQLLTGRNGGTWDAPTGFTSSAAAADPHLAVAYAEASQLLKLTGFHVATWSGQNVDATALLLTLAPYGDANLDGTINADDYALLDRSYARSLSDAHWSDGDFNYDGAVDASDYLLIDTTLGQAQGFSPGFLSMRESQFGATYVSTLLASVPEPTSLFAACGLAFLLPLTRRRRT